MKTMNNTNSDIRMFDKVISDAIKNGGVLPEELADIFKLTPVKVGDETRWIIDWA